MSNVRRTAHIIVAILAVVSFVFVALLIAAPAYEVSRRPPSPWLWWISSLMGVGYALLTLAFWLWIHRVVKQVMRSRHRTGLPSRNQTRQPGWRLAVTIYSREAAAIWSLFLVLYIMLIPNVVALQHLGHPGLANVAAVGLLVVAGLATGFLWATLVLYIRNGPPPVRTLTLKTITEGFRQDKQFQDMCWLVLLSIGCVIATAGVEVSIENALKWAGASPGWAVTSAMLAAIPCVAVPHGLVFYAVAKSWPNRLNVGQASYRPRLPLRLAAGTIFGFFIIGLCWMLGNKLGTVIGYPLGLVTATYLGRWLPQLTNLYDATRYYYQKRR